MFQPLDPKRFESALRRFDEENSRDPNREDEQPRELLYALTQTLVAARAAFLDALDAPAFGVTDAAVEREARQARAIGYSGKTIVDPQHVGAVHRVFTPAAEEIERARRLIAAYRDADAAGVGVLEFDGHVVDAVHVRIARRIVRQAELVAAVKRRGGG